ncbi:carboxymuconolactone decarboxylase family protein [Bradyrhizobium sp. LB11.1]|uniref:carboxymuconolactone decarboxylase family protein n=1 Tax=Bradyrhizobium sp. LB11.1 TaxID=3156326 RepID=UPI003398DA96
MGEGIRVPLIVPGTRPELAELEERISAERGRISLLYQVLLNSAPIASGWEQMLTAVRNQTSISAGLRELIILRVAVLNRASFEFEAHVPIAVRAGLDGGKIEAVTEKTVSQAFDPREKLALELTDAMTRDVTVPEHLFRRLKQEFDDKGIVELVATVAAYNMVSRFLVALNISH